MRSRSRFGFVFVSSLLCAPLAANAGGGSGSATATASVSVSIKADVNTKAQTQAAAGDAAYAAGKFDAALAVYGEGFAAARDSAFIYAMAHCHKALGHKDEAKAMFNIYLSASGSATLKYKAEADAELGTKAKSAVGAVGGLAGKVKDTTAMVVSDVGGGVYSAVKISIAGSINASAKASAESADQAYAAANYEDAAKRYLEAYATSQQSVALYGAAQAKAQAGHGVEARGLLLGYLASNSSGTYAKDARTLLLALGSRADLATQVSVSAKASTEARTEAMTGDTAMASGKFIDAAKAYGDAFAKKSDASLLYARGMAQLYAGATADAATSLKAYLAASGNLEFKVSAQASLQAAGGAS